VTRLTMEQWCGFACAAILGVICYAFPAQEFPWWLKTVIVVLTGVTALMIWDVRITYHRRDR
jgi:hypothetical protein